MNALSIKSENLHLVSNTNATSNVYQYGYQPVVTGEFVPTFFLPTQHGITGHFASSSFSREVVISLQDFLDYQQPLVIAFLGAPGQAAVNIQQLHKLHTDIEEHGGKLLILTAIEPKYLRRQLKQSNTLNIFHDEDNTIAELFGLYDLQNPLWQWVSGIEEEEQTIPALYVIAPDRKITFSYVDYTFSLFTGDYYPLQIISNKLLNSVTTIAAQYQYPSKAYKLVS